MKKKILIALLIIGVLLAAVFTFNIFYFLPGSTIEGVNVGLMKKDSVEGVINSSLSNKEFKIKLNNEEAKLKAEEIGLKANFESIQQVGLINYTLKNSSFVTEEDKLLKALEKSNILNGTVKTEDALIKKTDTAFILVPEVIGNQIDKEKAIALIKDGIKNNKEVKDLSSLVTQPKVKKDSPELLAKFKPLEKINKKKVSIDMVKKPEVLDFKIISTLIKDDSTIDEKKVSQYVDSLSEKYTTLFNNRDFKTHEGDVVTLSSSLSTFGNELDNKETYDRLLAALKSEKDEENIKAKFNLYTEEENVGNTYIEANLSSQMLYFYKDGKVILETKMLSGSPKNPSPPGIFKIIDKQQDTNLTSNAPNDSYNAHVHFWMPFTFEGHGIHDADWRRDDQFGGKNYLTVGSHGCLSLQDANAKFIYNNAPTGTIVVVHN